MQELIEAIKFTNKECYAIMLNEGIFDKLLQKEKDQIMKAFLEGKVNHSKDWSIEYYEKTYKENKKQHIIDIMKKDENDGLYN
jgi:Zn-finger nucleic acid-binding protein